MQRFNVSKLHLCARVRQFRYAHRTFVSSSTVGFAIVSLADHFPVTIALIHCSVSCSSYPLSSHINKIIASLWRRLKCSFRQMYPLRPLLYWFGLTHLEHVQVLAFTVSLNISWTERCGGLTDAGKCSSPFGKHLMFKASLSHQPSLHSSSRLLAKSEGTLGTLKSSPDTTFCTALKFALLNAESNILPIYFLLTHFVEPPAVLYIDRCSPWGRKFSHTL